MNIILLANYIGSNIFRMFSLITDIDVLYHINGRAPEVAVLLLWCNYLACILCIYMLYILYIVVVEYFLT